MDLPTLSQRVAELSQQVEHVVPVSNQHGFLDALPSPAKSVRWLPPRLAWPAADPHLCT
jgi:hypothetical protein